MTSTKQIHANRRNSKLGGVKTQPGKEIIRSNAIKHGITSKLLIDPEEQFILDQIINSLKSEYQPVGTMETFLVERIALCMLRLQRCAKFEDHYFYTASENNPKVEASKRVIPFGKVGA